MKRRFRFNLVMWVFIVPLIILGFISLVDKDPTVSELENRTLAQMPEFSFSALWSGEYTKALENYYSDTFPFREELTRVAGVLKEMRGFGDRIIISGGSTDLGQGEGSGDVPTESPDPNQPDDSSTSPQPTQPADTQPTEEPLQTKPPASDDVQIDSSGAVIVSGDTAFELVYYHEPSQTDYAERVNALKNSLSPNKKVYSLIAPTSLAFGAPSSYQKDAYSQTRIIDDVNSKLQDVITVDAYTAMAQHQTEYIHFRTDHHWTARGAYYAYTAFAQAAGFTAPSLDSFQTGRLDGFVGSYYRLTQASALQNNPDYVEYFLPNTQVEGTSYSNANLEGGTSVKIVNPDTTSSNKYLCFTDGDHGLVKFTTNAGTGRKIIVIKESYGNALIPFLTNNYDEVWVVDPRKISFNLEDFTNAQGIDEVLVVNYTLAISASSYKQSFSKLYE